MLWEEAQVCPPPSPLFSWKCNLFKAYLSRYVEEVLTGGSSCRRWWGYTCSSHQLTTETSVLAAEATEALVDYFPSASVIFSEKKSPSSWLEIWSAIQRGASHHISEHQVQNCGGPLNSGDPIHGSAITLTLRLDVFHLLLRLPSLPFKTSLLPALSIFISPPPSH